ncbi:hypothetical protein DVH26_33860 [Paenibacillus sp. H1-7]|uniref:hypothetical protein n=1 Tax=Paenibacillus sp. H1-7 TaxID=2282849 RepID=UPI001EF98D6E|nr:hypothetical protein [Paenibacillus sp. H1-7]ULL18984.1 hypothetical protein DVH26_33860 [Paenibacillus sp. H1-7]
MPTFDSINVTGNAEVQGDFQVDGNQTVQGDFQVNGSQTTQQHLGVGGSLAVDGTTILGAGSTPIVGHLSATVSLSWLTLSGNSSNVQNVVIPGVALGDNVYASADGGMFNIVWVAYVVAANTVQIQISNISNNLLQPPTRNWHIDVWKHS